MSNITFTLVEDGIGLVVLNRPEKRNALDDAAMLDLIEILESERVQGLSAIVLAGEGKHFCAGVDLTEIGTSRPTAAKPPGSRLFQAFRECGPVVIGAVHGYALGLGCGIAMACDLVVTADDSQFGYPAITHGLVNGVTMVGLKEIVGARKAMEMLVTGRRVPAQEALAIGMVNYVVPADQVRTRALEMAQSLGRNRLLAVQTTKQFFYEATDLSFAAATKAGERVVQLVRKADDPERSVPAAGTQGAVTR